MKLPRDKDELRLLACLALKLFILYIMLMSSLNKSVVIYQKF